MRAQLSEKLGWSVFVTFRKYDVLENSIKKFQEDWHKNTSEKEMKFKEREFQIISKH